MTRLDLYDTVVLKSDRQLVATVARTYHDTGHDQPLLDCLIVAHVPVDDTALASFIKSGYPPKDYVFVEFADQAQGSSLVHENDVDLLDRSFTLGDVVKKEGDQMLGTVINIAETYTVQPIWRKHSDISQEGYSLILTDDQEPPHRHVCGDECPKCTPEIEHLKPSVLIMNVPGQELKKAVDALEGDYIVKDDWLGTIEDISLTVTVMTEDGSIVVVHQPDDLYIPLPDFGDKPLVSLPEFDTDIPRPDIVVAQSGFSSTIPLPPDDYQSGQHVIAGRRNLKGGRWLRGQYNPDCSPKVLVLDARANYVTVRWLAYNPFKSQILNGRPSDTIRLYENINTFPGRSELRRDKSITILDQARLSHTTMDRRRNKSGHVPKNNKIVSSSDIRVGDHVKFRDQAGAAVKYQGITIGGAVHNRFERLSSTKLLGFDLNELKVVYSQQEITVQWQDGTVTQQLSREMKRFTLFESDMAPGDIIVAREGMQQRPVPSDISTEYGPWMTFNEMAFFEGQHDLKPQKVGIIQQVDPVERVAQVRWYVSPHVQLLNSGHILSGRSRFGEIEQKSEDVSLYEVMKFPALERRLKDMVMIVPRNPSNAGLTRLREASTTMNFAGAFPLSSVRPSDLDFWLLHAAHLVTSDTNFRNSIDLPTNASTNISNTNLDWVGDIVAIDLDGSVTIRVNAGEFYQDVLIEHDQIICFIDEAAITGAAENSIDGANDDESMDVDSFDGEEDEDDDEGYGEYDESDELMDIDNDVTISEIVEYEGGYRIDDDSDNENWEDDEDEMAETEFNPGDIPEVPEHQPAEDARLQDQSSSEESALISSIVNSDNITNFLSRLEARLPVEEPPAFEILDKEAPLDQFRITSTPRSTSSSFLKRINKEHRLLSTSLPAGQIYVRTYESRLDLIRCLIIGPRDTPYEYAPFLIDLHLGPNFPAEPPTAHFHSWTSGLGRVNPNLYEEGKICLSLLGTWQGQSETEGWSEKATLLQLLVSLQGLVFVSQPFYNEAGFEGYMEDGAYKTESERYSEKAFVMARRFVEHALKSPVVGLEDVLAWTYLPHGDSPGLLTDVISRGHSLIEACRNKTKSDDIDDKLLDGMGSNDDPTKVFLKPLSRGAIVMLEKTIRSLENLGTTGTSDDNHE